MPDFNDIPDLPVETTKAAEAPDAARWLRVHGSPATRAEVARARRVALALSVGWLGIQFFAFGAREDLKRLPTRYTALLIVTPLVAGVVAIVLAVRPGRLGLGSRALLVSGLALLGPLGFMLLGLFTPPPYAHGEVGNLMFGAYCLNCTVAWALLPMVAAGLALRGSFAAGSAWRSALLGVGCGLIAAGLFTLHCPVVGPWHVALAHGGAVLIAALIGGFGLTWLTKS